MFHFWIFFTLLRITIFVLKLFRPFQIEMWVFTNSLPSGECFQGQAPPCGQLDWLELSLGNYITAKILVYSQFSFVISLNSLQIRSVGELYVLLEIFFCNWGSASIFRSLLFRPINTTWRIQLNWVWVARETEELSSMCWIRVLVDDKRVIKFAHVVEGEREAEIERKTRPKLDGDSDVGEPRLSRLFNVY